MRSYRESDSVIVLGIDPGISNTGFGVVERRGNKLLALDGGVCRTAPELPIERRVAAIAGHVEQLIERHEPDALAIESIYFGKNAQTAFAVGQARGAILASAGRAGVEVHSYTPQQIKLAVCGRGGAGKEQVQRMVCAMLGLQGEVPEDHAADALAVGICHANGAPMREAIA
jgi:crossover junction endodeoxyribonuclease RuvC